MYAPLYAVQWKLRESGATWACRQAGPSIIRAGCLQSTICGRCGTTLIIPLVSREPRENVGWMIIRLSWLFKKFEKKCNSIIRDDSANRESRLGRSSFDWQSAVRNRDVASPSRSPANYSRNIIRGGVIDLHRRTLHFPRASSWSLITRTANNNAR